jgi:hypothetical protein
MPITRVALGAFNSIVQTITTIFMGIEIGTISKRIGFLNDLKATLGATTSFNKNTEIKKIVKNKRLDLKDPMSKTEFIGNPHLSNLYRTALDNTRRLEDAIRELKGQNGFIPDAKAQNDDWKTPLTVKKASDIRICVDNERHLDPICNCAQNNSCFTLDQNVLTEESGFKNNESANKLFDVTNSLMNGSTPLSAIDPIEMLDISREMASVAEQVRLKYNDRISKNQESGGEELPTFSEMSKEVLPPFLEFAKDPKVQSDFKRFQKTFSGAGVFELARKIHKDDIAKNPELAKEVEKAYSLGYNYKNFFEYTKKNPKVANDLQLITMEREREIKQNKVFTTALDNEEIIKIYGAYAANSSIAKKDGPSLFEIMSRVVRKKLH